MNYFPQERIEKYLAALQLLNETHGYDFLIHAIGDRGVREALNAIEKTKVPQARHRLTHLEMVHKEDVERFGELGVLADVQVLS